MPEYRMKVAPDTVAYADAETHTLVVEFAIPGAPTDTIDVKILEDSLHLTAPARDIVYVAALAFRLAGETCQSRSDLRTRPATNRGALERSDGRCCEGRHRKQAARTPSPKQSQPEGLCPHPRATAASHRLANRQKPLHERHAGLCPLRIPGGFFRRNRFRNSPPFAPRTAPARVAPSTAERRREPDALWSTGRRRESRERIHAHLARPTNPFQQGRVAEVAVRPDAQLIGAR